MQLSVRDLADACGLPPSAIYRWLKLGEVPGERILDEYRFNRLEVLDWALRKELPLRGDFFLDVDELQPEQTPFADALEAGGTVPIPGGPLGPEVVAALENALPELDPTPREHVLAPLRRRQVSGWICLGGPGIVVPRATRPLICEIPAPIVRIFYPATPGVTFPPALSRAPVVAWVWILAPTPLGHLQVLERLGKLLFGKRLAESLAAQAPASRLLADARRREKTLTEGLRPVPGQDA